jgi:hypothetical protein
MNTLNVALKEWNILIDALLAGEQAILLRKGGILEADNQFELEHKKFLLFPTFIHQDPRMTKPAFRERITTVRQEPDKLELKGYAEAVKIFEVPNRPAMDRLFDLHLWDTPLIDLRFAYRPEKPLYLVLVRAFGLPAPVIIANSLDYAGCKSWVPLEQPVDIGGARAAMSEAEQIALTRRITEALAA